MKIIKYVNCRVKNYMKEDDQAAQKSPPPPPRNFSNGLSLIVTERGGESGEVL